jgi:glutamate dehydrogenase (NADP+)
VVCFKPDVDEVQIPGVRADVQECLDRSPWAVGRRLDFNPKGKSETEIRRFCVAFMTDSIATSVPLPMFQPVTGVSGREIGYMCGQYKDLQPSCSVLHRKSLNFGGSPLRPEATGYGLVYMAQLAVENDSVNL